MSYQAPAPCRRRPAPSALLTAGQGGAGTRRRDRRPLHRLRRPALSYRWPAAQPDQVKPENGHHNMMARPALSPLPAVSPTPVATTEVREAAACQTRTANCPQRPRLEPARQRGHAKAEASPEPLSRTPKAVVTTGRTLGAIGYVPEDTSRKERGARARAAREAERGARRAKLEEHRRQVQSERQARKAAAYLPANGEPGPSALRSYRRLRVEPHRATSEVLSVAYPLPRRGRPRRRRCPGRPRLLVWSGLRVRPVDAVCEETGD